MPYDSYVILQKSIPSESCKLVYKCNFGNKNNVYYRRFSPTTRSHLAHKNKPNVKGEDSRKWCKIQNLVWVLEAKENDNNNSYNFKTGKKEQERNSKSLKSSTHGLLSSS